MRQELQDISSGVRGHLRCAERRWELKVHDSRLDLESLEGEEGTFVLKSTKEAENGRSTGGRGRMTDGF